MDSQPLQRRGGKPVHNNARRSLVIEALEDRVVPTVNAVNDIYWVLPTYHSGATSVLVNDTGSSLTVPEVNGNASDVGQAITLPSGSTLKLFANGSFEFTPAVSLTSDSFTYKTTDGTYDDTATVNIYVTDPTPDELYDTYLDAVDSANEVYADAVEDAIDTRDAAIAAARAAAQDEADDLYDDYLAAYETAEAVYIAAIADAEDDYETAVAAADATWATANDAAMADYDDAIADAQATYDAALATLQSDYDDAIAAADAAYDTAVAPYLAGIADAEDDLADAQDAYDAAEATLASVNATALAIYEAAEAAALSAYETALGDADEIFEAAKDDAKDDRDDAYDAADAAYAATVAPYQSARDAAYTYWQNNLSDPGAEAAYLAAEDDLTDAITSATSTRVAAKSAADNAYADAVSDATDAFDLINDPAEADYNDAVMIAGGIYSATIAPYEAALFDLQSDLTAAETALDVALEDIAPAIADRDDAYAAAQAVFDAGVVDVEEDLTDAYTSANAVYDEAMEEPTEDWYDAEAAAWASFRSTTEENYEDFTDAEATAWAAYTSGIAIIDSELAATESGILDDFDGEFEVIAGLATWESAESDAWDTYESEMALVPGTPGLEERVYAPPSGQSFVGCLIRPEADTNMVLEEVQAQAPAQMPLLDWARATPVAGQAGVRVIWGNVSGREYSVPVRGGGTVAVWRPDAGVQADHRYFCHGLTFGGWNAPGGPFSPFSGAGISTILAAGYMPIAQRDARVDDIVVWQGPGNNSNWHSAILAVAIAPLNGNNLSANQQFVSKNGQDPSAVQTLQQLNLLYGTNIQVYRLRR